LAGTDFDDVEAEEENLRNYSVKVGARLRLVRKQMRLSLQAVEAMSNQEFKASVLGAYERGERAISVPRLQRLAALYDVPVDQLLPREEISSLGSWPDEESSLLRRGSDATGRNGKSDFEEAGKITIDLTKLHKVSGPERDLLRRYLGMIQVQRQDFNGRVITIRYDDLRAIACLFGVSADAMGKRLKDLDLLATSSQQNV